MKIKKAVLVYFSPTGGTKHIAELLGRSLGMETEELDITEGKPQRSFSSDELAVFAMPVYGGRIPAPVHERMAELEGNNTPAVIVSVYGNRAVDDAGLEMADAARKKNFYCIGGGEFITRHSVDTSYGSGRPDEDDLAVMDEFAEKLRTKLEAEQPAEVKLPGNRPYVNYGGIPIKPSVRKSLCAGCGKCASHCPTGAIDIKHPQKTDKSKCISCMGCISVCPSGARHISALFRFAGKRSLKNTCSERQNPTYYI